MFADVEGRATLGTHQLARCCQESGIQALRVWQDLVGSCVNNEQTEIMTLAVKCVQMSKYRLVTLPGFLGDSNP